MLVAYSLGDAIWAMLIFCAWVAVLGFGIWLLIATLRNRKVPRWVKALLVLFIIIFPPVTLVACLVIWIVMGSRYPRVWESAIPLGVVTGPAEVHRLDGSVVIVEAGEQYEAQLATPEWLKPG